MKQLYCILFGVVILLAGCEKENSINSIMAPLRTDDDYSVSLHSVEALFQRTDVNTRGLLSSSASSSILPFTLLNETVFYIDFACPAYNVCHGSARGDYAAIGYD